MGTEGLFPNKNDATLIQLMKNVTIGKSADDIWQNDSPSNRYYEAQKQADLYAKLKERVPMVIEYKETKDKWKTITMYINPDRLSIANQKVKGKAYTRGGIFYHHWGDDSPVLSLSGTTGLSGMRGIEVLEEIYSASGTLLKYQKFGPEKYAQPSASSNVDINSPSSVLNTALNAASDDQIDALHNMVNADNVRNEKWKEYKNIRKKLDAIQKNKDGKNSEASKYKKENDKIKKKYPTAITKKMTIDSSDADIKKAIDAYLKAFKDYLADKKKYDDEMYNTSKNPKDHLTKKQIKDLLKEITDENKKWKFENNISIGKHSADKEFATGKKYEQAKIDLAKYRDNAKKYKGLKTTIKGENSSISKYLSKLNKMQAQYGFPTGTYIQLSKMKLPLNAKKITSLKNSAGAALATFKNLKDLNKFSAQLLKIEDQLQDWVKKQKTKPSSGKYKKEALTRLHKAFPKISDDLITAIVDQKVIYYQSGMGDVHVYAQYTNNLGVFNSSTWGEAVSTDDSPILYRDDIMAQIMTAERDRSDYLSSFLSDMSDLETSERNYYEQLQSALDDIKDDLEDEWRPRQIVIYYENRVYVGHFDSFSYNRDAANPLLIRYEMRMTLSKQIVGTNK